MEDARHTVAVQRSSILAIACASMAAFGIVMASLGASLPHVIAGFGIDKREAGALLSLLSFSILAASVVFGPIVDRRGHKALLLFAFTGIILGLELTAFAPSVSWLSAGIALSGFSGGLVNGAANTLVADVSGERRAAALTFTGGFFGVGAAGVPFVLATFSDSVSYTALIGAVGAFVLVPLALTALAAFPPAKQPHAFPLSRARALLSDPVLLLVGLILFVESGMESTIGGWTPTFFAEELGATAERAPIYLALFWLGLMLTRIVLGILLKEFSRVPVLFAGAGLALASALWLLTTHDLTIAATAVFFLGCGFAPIYPLMYGVVGDRYANVSGTALSVVIAIALVGGMLMPYVAGVLGRDRGLRVSLVVVPGSLVLLALLMAYLTRRLSATDR